jgi:opacity protein-like surface antigen
MEVSTMKMKLTRAMVLAPVLLTGLLVTAAPAKADGLFTPYGGVTFGGNSANGKGLFGASLGFMSAGVFGLEADVAHSPNFFGEDFDGIADASITTAMVNLLVGVPVGGTNGVGVRPYVTAGAGLIRASVTSPGDLFDDVNRNDMGVNVGGGVVGFFNDHVGLRGDVRYFRSLQGDDDEPVGVSLSDFDFMRATVGVTLRF